MRRSVRAGVSGKPQSSVNFISNLERQRGQAAVFVFFFLAVLVVGLSTLYKAGKITSDKMMLQNASDAAAYSVSVVEARDLNFASYMNRAIVANEVAIGQLVGLASWAFHWRSFNDYLSLYSTPLKTPPITPLGTALEAMAKGFQISGDVFKKIMTPLANYGTTITHNINKFYGYAEFGYHLVTTAYSLGQIKEMIKQNAPPGGRLSEYGLLGLIAHLATYGALPGLPGEQFTKSYDPTAAVDFDEFKDDVEGNSDAGGYGRLAALIHDSSDPFVKGRGWTFDFFNELYNAGLVPDFLYHTKSDGSGWVGIDEGLNIDLALLQIDFRIWLLFHLDLSRLGGSELRMVSDQGKAAGKFFNWSSADTTNLGMGFDGGFYVSVDICLPLIGCESLGSLGGNITIYNDNLSVSVSIAGFDIDLLNTPFPTNVPFGAAFVQAGTKSGTGAGAVDNFLTSIPEQMGRTATGGTLEPDRYGGAASKMLAWEFVVPPGIFFQAGMPDRQVNKKYRGLPRYMDTTNTTPLLGSGGANLVLGAVLDEEEFDLGHGTPAAAEVEPVGRFKITEKMAQQQLSVISKSEVYFRRPTDLSYFRRGDGQEEFGSTFNPYWNARLVETSHADRAVALLMQQRVNYEGITIVDVMSALFKPFLEFLGL